MKKCGKCGADNPDHAAFCSKCGTAFEKCVSDTPKPGPQLQEPRKPGKALVAAGCAAIVLIIAAGIGGGYMALKHLSGGGAAGAGDSSAYTKGYDLEKVELVSSYIKPESSGTIDLYADNRQPAARDLNGKWDKTLFYWLEDADAASQEDNHIVDCRLERTSLTRTDNGNKIDYEVYRDPQSNAIYKIVSIEYQNSQSLELTDYYYMDGTPNFIFRRSDSAYTPTYASIDKVGERYYFSQDQMVKWRWIYEPQVVKQWILALEDTWYTQWAYSDISQDEQRQYDDKEREMLNAAYNTYAAIENDVQPSLLEGIVLDENGKPMEGAWVAVGEQATGEPFVKMQTGADGRYAWEVTDLSKNYFLIIQKDDYINTVMEPMMNHDGGLQMEQEQVVLYGKAKGTVPVSFDVFQMAEADTDLDSSNGTEDGQTLAMPSLNGAEIEIRWGINHVSGAAMVTVQSDQSGKASLELKRGTYTATVKKEGFAPMTAVFSVNGETGPVKLYCMKENKDSVPVWMAVLTWENEGGAVVDLDSAMFTPQKGEAGNMVCINTLNRADSRGNRFVYDGKGDTSCEVIQLTNPEKGSYRYYVNDYESALSGGQSGEGLRRSNAVVRVYKSGQLAKTFRVPVNGNGVIWEVFEIRNDEIIPIQNLYSSAEGKGWWIQDKAMARLNDRSMKADWIQSDGEWLYFSNPMDRNRLYYCRKDGSGLTQLGDDQVEAGIVLVGDTLYYMAHYGYDAVCSLKYDGSGRTELKSQIMTPNTDGSCNQVVGYCDGILYTCIAPASYTFTLQATDLASGKTWNLDIPDGNGMYSACDRIQVVGDYVYFAYNSVGDSDEIKFCRQKLDGGSTEIISTIGMRGIWDFTILKGWVYFNTQSGGYCMQIDGSQLMSWDNTDLFKAGVIDGEVYGKDCKVYDAGGGYIRNMFNSAAFSDRNAREAYKSFLKAPVRSENAQDYPGYFAVMDINNDGVSELLYLYDLLIGSVSGYGGLDIYTYDPSADRIYAISEEVYCDSLAFNQEGQQLISYSNGRSGVSNLVLGSISGNQINWEELASSLSAGDTFGDQASLDEYMAVYNSRFKGKPLLQFVENNQPNRDIYLSDGVDTGFVDASTIDWTSFTPYW